MLRIRKNGGFSECSVPEALVGKVRRCDHLNGEQYIIKDKEDYDEKYTQNFKEIQSMSLNYIKNTINKNKLLKNCSDSLKKTMETENSSYVVAATGFGKSIIIQETCLEQTIKGNSVLIVGQKGQKDSFASNGMSETTHVDFMGYEEFYKKDVDLTKYSTVIFDECQKTVSANESAVISVECQNKIELAKALNIKTIGFTASPERTDGENVETAFGKCAYKCDIYEAIEGNCYTNLPNYYVPEFTLYHYTQLQTLLAKADKEKLSRSAQKEFQAELFKIAKYGKEYSSIEKVRESEEKYIEDLVDKTIKENNSEPVKIVFHCKTIEESKEYKNRYKTVLSKFGKCSFGTFVSGDDQSDETKAFFDKETDSTKDSKIVAIFTVDKYSTGYHDDNLAIQVIAYQKQSVVGKIQTNGRSYGKRNFSCKVVDLWNCHSTNLGISWKNLQSSSKKLGENKNTMKFDIKSSEMDQTLINLANIIKKDKGGIVDGSEIYTPTEVSKILFENYKNFSADKKTNIRMAVKKMYEDGFDVEELPHYIYSIENHKTYRSGGKIYDCNDLPIKNK